MSPEPLFSTRAEWVIEPRRAGIWARSREVWHYRHLIRFFGGRALAKTYRRTVLGWLWVFIRPLVTVSVSAAVFHGIVGIEAGETPYFLFFLVGMTCWSLFDSAVTWTTRSLELNRRLLKKQYVPRLVLPIACLAPALAELGINLGVILLTATYYRVTAGTAYIALGLATGFALLAIVLTCGLALAIGLWTSVLAAKARDVRFLLAYVLQPWFFVTPVIYPLTSVPERWRWLAELNPLTTIVELFRWGVLGEGVASPAQVAGVIAVVAVVMLLGLAFFDRTESATVEGI
jgi:lipopolysaccharide transport system permease protein